MITFDLETFRFRRPVAAPRPVCVQWCDRAPRDDQDGYLELYSVERMRQIFAQDRILGHGLSYDTLVMMADDEDLIDLVFQAYREDRVEDTLINQKLIDIAYGELKHQKTRGYDLGRVAYRHGIEVDKSDPWRLRYGSLANVPLENWPKGAVSYAILDATAAWRIAVKQDLISAAWEAQYGSPILHQGPARARADLALRLASTWGVRSDAKRIAVVEEFTNGEIARMKEILVAEGLVRKVGSKDTKAAKAIVEKLFKAANEEVPLTDKGQVSTEKDTMILAAALHPKGSELARLGEIMITYAEYTTANNLLNRVEDLKKGVHLPLQPRYDSLLETGRTSSSKGKVEEGQLEGIQIQNFPRGFDKRQKKIFAVLGLPVIGARECLTTREGNVFVLADYSSVELHTLAQTHIWMFGQSKLAEILNAGKDVHMLFGSEAYGNGTKYEDVIKQKGWKDLDPYKDWRQAAKPIVFGRPGGMGPAKIVITARKSYNVIFDLVEANRLIRLYDGMIPELPLYFDHVKGLLGGRSRCLLRQMATGRWRGGCTYSGAANSYFQGLAADGALAALYRVAEECYSVRNSALYGFRIVAFVHDEIVLEGPEERAHEAALRLQRVMEEEMDKYTPDCPTPAEPIVTRVWSKSAKQVWNNGQLMPWEAEWYQQMQEAA